MQIYVKLMAYFRSKLPAGAKGGTATLELENGARVVDALVLLKIPAEHVHLVMVNGAQEPDRKRILADGDELVVFPPVAGG
jgi:molybdopterin converting factor small subunit